MFVRNPLLNTGDDELISQRQKLRIREDTDHMRTATGKDKNTNTDKLMMNLSKSVVPKVKNISTKI